MLSRPGGCSFGRRRHGLHRDHFTGAGANRVLGVLVEDRVGTEDLAGPPKPAARAAFFGIWGEAGRDAEESVGIAGGVLPGGGMHWECSRGRVWDALGGAPRGRISDASPYVFPVTHSSLIRRRAKPVTRTPPSTARRPLSPPRPDGPPASHPSPAHSVIKPSQDTA